MLFRHRDINMTESHCNMLSTSLSIPPDMESEVARGAEAVVTNMKYIGRTAICKTRPPKGYRHPDLDSRLRLARTRNEAKLMHDAKEAGVRTPCIYDVDLLNCRIIMEKVSGKTVKNVLDTEPDRVLEVSRMIGETIARLHSARISHGDLTTSNMILCGNEICLIDFSMGKGNASDEGIGVDVRLLERAFTSAHPGMESAFSELIETYYKKIPDEKAIRKKVEEIRNRCRYT